jgi:hypothetical protein
MDVQEGKEGDNMRGINKPMDSDYPLENMHWPSLF